MNEHARVPFPEALQTEDTAVPYTGLEPAEMVANTLVERDLRFVLQQGGLPPVRQLGSNGVALAGLNFLRNFGRDPYEVQAERYAKELAQRAIKEEMNEERRREKEADTQAEGNGQSEGPKAFHTFESRKDVQQLTERAQEIQATYRFTWNQAYALASFERGKLTGADRKELKKLQDGSQTREKWQAYQADRRGTHETTLQSHVEDEAPIPPTVSQLPRASKSDWKSYQRLAETYDDPEKRRRIIQNVWHEDPGKYGL